MIPFALLPVHTAAVPALCRQLRTLEAIETDDTTTMDAVIEAQQIILAALGNACSRSLREVSQKIIAITRRADAADGFLSRAECLVLISASMDLASFEVGEDNQTGHGA